LDDRAARDVELLDELVEADEDGRLGQGVGAYLVAGQGDLVDLDGQVGRLGNRLRSQGNGPFVDVDLVEARRNDSGRSAGTGRVAGPRC
jgi:hypothetical protein